MVAVFLVALLMAAGEPAPASGAASAATPPASAAPAPAKPKPAKKICWQEKPTGSHFSKEICPTPDELEQMQHNAQDVVAAHVRPAPGAFGPGH